MKGSNSDTTRVDQNAARRRLAPRLCAAILLVLNLAFYSRSAPVLRLVESAVCREYYVRHDPGFGDAGGYIEEKFCKVDEVQKKVAWLFALDQLLHFCCGKLSIISCLTRG